VNFRTFGSVRNAVQRWNAATYSTSVEQRNCATGHSRRSRIAPTILSAVVTGQIVEELDGAAPQVVVLASLVACLNALSQAGTSLRRVDVDQQHCKPDFDRPASCTLQGSPPFRV
jgi:hypothetical protein